MRKRSPAYPQYPLSVSEAFAVSVYENVGDTILGNADLAKNGKIAARDADTYANTAAQYGWMTQTRGKGYSSNRSVCIALRTPKGDAEKNKLYLDAFLNVPLYKLIVKAYNGKSVTAEGLKIDLIRDHDFSDVGAKAAANVFIANAKFLGLIDDENNFNIDAEITIDPTVIKEKRTKTKDSTSTTKSKNTQSAIKTKPEQKNETPAYTVSGAKKKVTIYIRGEKIVIPLPEDMTQSEWDYLIETFQNIKSFAK